MPKPAMLPSTSLATKVPTTGANESRAAVSTSVMLTASNTGRSFTAATAT